MAADPNSIVQEAVDVAIGERGEIGLQVTASLDDEPVVDVWGGWVRRLGAEVTPRASRSASGGSTPAACWLGPHRLTHGARSVPGTSDLLDSTVPSNGSLPCDDDGQSDELDVVLDGVLRYSYNRSRQRLHLGPTSFVEVMAPSWQQLFGERLLWVRT